jgi:SAM-dependent methyltransferase
MLRNAKIVFPSAAPPFFLRRPPAGGEAMSPAVPSVFEAEAARYDAWFERHAAAYASELAALRELWPGGPGALEVGVGGGRFAAPLGIAVGLDPSRPLLELARARGVAVVQGWAEALPFADAAFDALLMVTVLCFADPAPTLAEAGRVLRPGGTLVVGLLDTASPPGRALAARAAASPFYRDARLEPAGETAARLAAAGFAVDAWRQTLAVADPPAPEAPRPGHGGGLFCAVRATKTVSPLPGRR